METSFKLLGAVTFKPPNRHSKIGHYDPLVLRGDLWYKFTPKVVRVTKSYNPAVDLVIYGNIE